MYLREVKQHTHTPFEVLLTICALSPTQIMYLREAKQHTHTTFEVLLTICATKRLPEMVPGACVTASAHNFWCADARLYRRTAGLAKQANFRQQADLRASRVGGEALEMMCLPEQARGSQCLPRFMNLGLADRWR
eukprot:scaffold30924_cov17-Tisochrysis_lutea.AAC.1